jgi:hypothetical protein
MFVVRKYGMLSRGAIIGSSYNYGLEGVWGALQFVVTLLLLAGANMS